MGTYGGAINSAVLANLRHKEGLDPTSPGWILLAPVSHKPSSLCTFPPAAESPCWLAEASHCAWVLVQLKLGQGALFAFRQMHSSLPAREWLNNQQSQISNTVYNITTIKSCERRTHLLVPLSHVCTHSCMHTNTVSQSLRSCLLFPARQKVKLTSLPLAIELGQGGCQHEEQCEGDSVGRGGWQQKQEKEAAESMSGNKMNTKGERD